MPPPCRGREGCSFTVRAMTWRDAGADRMIFVLARTLGFLLVRRVLGVAGFGPAPDAKDVEIAVLRHQLVVLRRQVVVLLHPGPAGCCSPRSRTCCPGTAGRCS